MSASATLRELLIALGPERRERAIIVETIIVPWPTIRPAERCASGS
jgi:sulfur carrier protein ThiS